MFRSGERGAGEGTRTLDINLGKVALYQLSYARTLGPRILSVAAWGAKPAGTRAVLTGTR